MRMCISGAGGFIGHHLVNYLKAHGHWVRGVDIKRPVFTPTAADEFLLLDLRDRDNGLIATRDVDWCFGLAADMGGMGFIANPHNQASIARNNTLLNLNTLDAARENGVARYLFSSSACIYPLHLQAAIDDRPLKEDDAFPSQPQGAYGWEKLYFELMCGYYDMPTRIARFHNTYGPLGAWNDGREKAPAALCRKVAQAKRSGNPEIEIWGDGLQMRSFLYVDDCVRGILMLMESDCPGPLNIGSEEQVSINRLTDMIAGIAGIKIVKVHVSGPEGVRGRNADLTRVRKELGWEPRISLREGLTRTYQWIEEQVNAA